MSILGDGIPGQIAVVAVHSQDQVLRDHWLNVNIHPGDFDLGNELIDSISHDK